MDHRTGLPGTETGTRAGTLRRKRLARISPSRDPVHRRVRLPGSRKEPFFPLNSRRLCWITSPEAPAGLHAARRHDASAPNGTIPTPSQVYVLRLRGTYPVSFRIVHFAAHSFYNTVVLEELLRGLIGLGCAPLAPVVKTANLRYRYHGFQFRRVYGPRFR